MARPKEMPALGKPVSALFFGHTIADLRDVYVKKPKRPANRQRV